MPVGYAAVNRGSTYHNNGDVMKENHKGTHIPGSYMVVDSSGQRVGKVSDKLGPVYPTMSKARKAQKSGQALVRESDRVCVSVK